MNTSSRVVYEVTFGVRDESRAEVYLPITVPSQDKDSAVNEGLDKLHRAYAVTGAVRLINVVARRVQKQTAYVGKPGR